MLISITLSKYCIITDGIVQRPLFNINSSLPVMGMSFLNSLNQMSFSDCTNIYRSQDHVTVDCNFLSDPG